MASSVSSGSIDEQSEFNSFKQQIDIALYQQENLEICLKQFQIDKLNSRLIELVGSDGNTFNAQNLFAIQGKLKQLHPSRIERITNTEINLAGLSVNSSTLLKVGGVVASFYFGCYGVALGGVVYSAVTHFPDQSKQVLDGVLEKVEPQLLKYFPSSAPFLLHLHDRYLKKDQLHIRETLLNDQNRNDSEFGKKIKDIRDEFERSRNDCTREKVNELSQKLFRLLPEKVSDKIDRKALGEALNLSEDLKALFESFQEEEKKD